MYKKGFTLQEVLISIGIIGIVAAMVAPAIQNAMPDDTKSKYIKIYNTLTNQINDIMDDNSLYWTTYDSSGTADCSGLKCGAQPQIEPYASDNNCSNLTKFPAILAHHLNLAGGPNYSNGNAVVFTTVEGTKWTFKMTDDAQNNDLTTNLTIDINQSAKGTNSTFSANENNPDRFTFLIDKDGTVTATDVLGIVFLQNPTKLNAIKDDKNLAKKIIEKVNENSDEISNVDKMYKALKELQKGSTTDTTTKKTTDTTNNTQN